MIRRYTILPLVCIVAVALILVSASVTDPCPREANVQLEKQNVFYEGVVNPISVRVTGIPNSDLVVEVSGPATISPTGSPGRYNVFVDSSGKVFVSVFYMENGKKINVEQCSYRVKRIQDPVTFIENIRNDGVILKENLQKITGVFTRMVNCDYDCSFKPQSFSMSVIEAGEWKEYKATGPELTPEMKTALTKCEEEDKIIFHNVMTKGPAGDVRHVNSVTITVK